MSNVPSYRLGSLFVRFGDHGFYPSFHSDSGLSFQIGLELIGSGRHRRRGHVLLQNPSSQTFLLFPTNGVGFGHSTRMYALAGAEGGSNVVCIFFTTMPVLHVLYQERFITYHISGRKRLDGFEAREWNTIVEEMLRIVIKPIIRPRSCSMAHSHTGGCRRPSEITGTSGRFGSVEGR